MNFDFEVGGVSHRFWGWGPGGNMQGLGFGVWVEDFIM